MINALRTPSDYRRYFEDIATRLKPIGHSSDERHFFRTIDEFTGTNIKYPAMVYIMEPSRLTDNKSDNLIKISVVQLWILMDCSLDDVDRQLDIYDQAEEICTDILSFILKDVEDVNSGPQNRRIFGFDPGGISWVDMYHKGQDNCFGMQMTIPIKNPFKITYDPDKWL